MGTLTAGVLVLARIATVPLGSTSVQTVALAQVVEVALGVGVLRADHLFYQENL